MPIAVYSPSLALLTDLYQLTMAYGYWKLGMHERRACFHLFFRRSPFSGEHAIACGLETAADYLDRLRFDASDVEYLATLTGNDGAPLFEAGFLAYLAAMRFECDIDGIAEGTTAFPHQPLIRVTGPLIQAQLIETPLLNMVNFETLIATKADRICRAAQGRPVLEFGLRRAQGPDGGLSAARAAYIGGCTATSNVLAGKLLGIPVRGTHAHSWVMCFDTESQAFESYANAMPNNCVFLVDTYDTIEGTRRAIEAGRRLRQRGHEMVGIRLDSGDMAQLSIDARKLLDEAGFPNAVIVASNDLDEYRIADLIEREGQVGVFGVGTRLVTARDQPALGGVYKLAAITDHNGAWSYRIKLSEDAIKVSNPGRQQVRRYTTADGQPIGDVLYEEDHGVTLPALSPRSHDLLVPVFRGGQRVLPAADSLDCARTRCITGPRPIDYEVHLDPALLAIKNALLAKAVEGNR